MQPDIHSSTRISPVWIVEDSESYAETVQDLVNAAPDLTCPHVFATGEALLEFLADHYAPDAMLIDIGLPGMDGIETVDRVSRITPATHLVMLTIHEDDDRIFKALCAGATGYLLKTARPQEILDALREVLRGGAPMTPQIARRVLNFVAQQNAPHGDYQLTPRELDVLGELVAGKSKKQIAGAIDRSVHTVDTHVRNIYAKLQVHTRTQAVVRAVNENLLPRQVD